MKTNKELLEHDLCPRLTYGVKLKFYGSDTYYELAGIGKEPDGTKKAFIHLSDEKTVWYGFDAFKPIYRPMSDLTKEITHKGETFIIFDLIVKKMQAGEVLCVKNMDMLPFWIVEILRKYHFALDLPAHLWVDVNSLPENPYHDKR